METYHHDSVLFQPLLLPNTASAPETSTTATTTSTKVHKDDIKAIISSSSDIILQFTLVILFGTISLWANYEASKGFAISIINDAGDSLAGRRFSHFYISDDKATRIILNTSKFVENILYPDHLYQHHIHYQNSKKQVNHVILRLASENMSADFMVESRINYKYVLHLNPLLLNETDFHHAIVSAILLGMTRIWLWDGHGTVPEPLINVMIEYICMLSGFSRKINNNSNISTQMLVHCMKQNSSFIRELNQAMKEKWHDRTVGMEDHIDHCNYKFHF